jgi:hypothetical protein
MASAAAGTAVLLQCAATAWLLRADGERVYLLGRPIFRVCALRSRYGLPCPTCGMTRSIVLTLHGEIGRAWHLAPAGPVTVFGLLLFAAAMLVLARVQRSGTKPWEDKAKGWIQNGALTYGGAALVVWVTGWALRFQEAWHVR